MKAPIGANATDKRSGMFHAAVFARMLPSCALCMPISCAFACPEGAVLHATDMSLGDQKHGDDGDYSMGEGPAGTRTLFGDVWHLVNQCWPVHMSSGVRKAISYTCKIGQCVC